MIETAIHRTQGDNYCVIYTGERKFINKLKSLSVKYPNEVTIEYINSDGSMVAQAPYNWFKFVAPIKQRNYTEEQRKAMGERMKKAREKNK